MPSLPYYLDGSIIGQGGAVVTPSMTCSVWPAQGSTDRIGQVYDHEGEAPITHATALKAANRTLRVNGVDYKIVQAVEHSFIPHVALLLRRVVPGGGG